MKILFFGDIFGRPGRTALKKYLPELIKKHKPDFVVANIENIAHGRGITRNTLMELHEIGLIDVFTSGDHIWDTKEARELVKDNSLALLRPLNLEGKEPGYGATVAHSGSKKLLVVNLLGEVFMNKLTTDNPFNSIDSIFNRYTLDPDESEKEYVNGILVDFHAEATSEKRVLGAYLDGKISALIGTHTHVPTRDEQILPKGTAYITDAGMVGPYNSSLGLDFTSLIKEYKTGSKQKREVGDDPMVEIGAVLIETNKSGLGKSIKHLRQLVRL